MDEQFRRMGRDVPMHNVPQVVKFTTKPDVSKYYLHAFFYWDPEVQFGLPISKKSCPKCSGSLRFKERSAYRAVYDVHEDVYFCSATYQIGRAHV